MYVPMSDNAKEAMMATWRVHYYATCVVGTDVKDAPTTISMIRTDRPTDRPVNLFTMKSTIFASKAACKIYDLKEVMPVDIKELMPARVFLLEMVLRDIIRELRADDYKFLFVTSEIPHIVDVFLDLKFRVRRKTDGTTYLGYKKIQ